jgi:nucleoside-diphosphate-sugar epimerase
VRVLVTGATGFLGARLVGSLVTAGHDVVALSRRPAPERLGGNPRITWLQRDIALEGLRPDDVRGVEAVFHLAGATLGARSDEHGFLQANEAATVRLLQVALPRVGRIVFASSQAVYGNANHVGVTEDFPLNGLASAYACSKLNGENWLRWFQQRHGGLCVVLRLSGFVEGGGIIDYICDRALRDEPIELFSRGAVRRDYLGVQQGVEAFVDALRFQAPAGFVPFNIGSGRGITALELATTIRSQLRSSSEIVLSDTAAPQGDFVFDVTKAVGGLGFDPGDPAEAVRAHVLSRHAAMKGGSTDA